jgi:hypothetical protein
LGSRSRLALGLAAAAAALAGCPTKDVEPRTFRIQATVDGTPLEARAAEPTYYVLFGTGEVQAPTALRLPAATLASGEAFGDVVVSFDGGAAPEAVFDPSLNAVPVRLLVLADPAHAGPTGEPLPIPGFRVATGASPDFRHRLLLWEGTYLTPAGIAAVFAPAGSHADDPGTPDIPVFMPEAVYAAWEPAKCGLVYYDAMNVVGETEGDDLPLEQHEQALVQVGTVEPPWNVLHVESWHRDGRCDGQAQAFSQLAAWRPPAAVPAQ